MSAPDLGPTDAWSGEPHAPRWRRALHWTCPLFRFSGVQVRVSWTAGLWPIVFAWGFAEWLSLGAALGWAVVWTVYLFATVWVHEMGHVLAGRRFGIDTSHITLRGLGGLAHLDSEASTPKQDIAIAMAGPAVHVPMWLLMSAAVWLLRAHEGEVWWYMLSAMRWMQLVMLVFNLLPFYPLDGGRAARSLYAFRVHPNKASLVAATVGMVAWVLIGIAALGVLPIDLLVMQGGDFDFLLVWLSIWAFMACMGLRRQARYGEIYAHHDPYARAMLQSKRAEQAAVERESREEARARKKREKVRAERDRVQARVDELLDRISTGGGVDALSAAERRELERASARLTELQRSD